ncbi:MAG: hypothetical protein HY314_02570 [Acidobacteria bacterium]|nr:hypothetical protein [Acidobacteriota bacterium]
MMDNLKNAFLSYTEAVQSRLQSASTEPKAKGPLRLIRSPAVLRSLVEKLEEEIAFKQLVAETRSAFAKKHDCSNIDELLWQEAVQNFFRRSGYYIKAFDGEAIDFDDAFQKYEEAFQRTERQITYLAPMEDVLFANPNMDISAFQIKSFKAAELEAILQNTINQVFYPWAAITGADLQRLHYCWFICVDEPAPMPKLGDVTFWYSSRVSIRCTEYPKVLESVLQPLALYDWQADGYRSSQLRTDQRRADKQRQETIDPWVHWKRFKIPFWLTADDNLLDTPMRAPDTSRVEIYVDPQTGEWEGQHPIMLDKNETEAFEAFVLRMGKLLAGLKAEQNGWDFAEVALCYLVKAFFTEGLEQLLWHITVLEALLGEKYKVTDSVARRLASILGRTENEQKSIKKQFKKLYNYRCDLVHGNVSQDAPHFGHLRIARVLARRTLLWFLEYLGHIQARIQQDQNRSSIPQRGDILTLIDLDQQSRLRLGHLIEDLPAGFPYVPEWME